MPKNTHAKEKPQRFVSIILLAYLWAPNLVINYIGSRSRVLGTYLNT